MVLVPRGGEDAVVSGMVRIFRHLDVLLALPG